MYVNVGIKQNILLYYLLPNNLTVNKNNQYMIVAFDDLVVLFNIKVTTQLVCLYN